MISQPAFLYVFHDSKWYFYGFFFFGASTVACSLYPSINMCTLLCMRTKGQTFFRMLIMCLPLLNNFQFNKPLNFFKLFGDWEIDAHRTHKELEQICESHGMKNFYFVRHAVSDNQHMIPYFLFLSLKSFFPITHWHCRVHTTFFSSFTLSEAPTTATLMMRRKKWRDFE